MSSNNSPTYSNFFEAMDHYFPGALELDEYLDQLEQQLKPLGFTKQTTLPLVCVCRDEICLPLLTHVGIRFGKCFQCSGLGGFLFLGKTGLGAAKAHAKRDAEGREHLLYCAMPHIGFNQDGVPGMVHREGQAQSSTACGALTAMRNEMSDGHLGLEMNNDDSEMILMKQRLLQEIRYGDIPSQVELTKTASSLIEKDLVRLVSIVQPAEKDGESYYAILSGVQIHGNVKGEEKESRYIWPLTSYAVVDGKKIDITFKHDSKMRESAQKN